MHHYQQVEKSLGKPPKEIENLPQLGDDLMYLWFLYVDLHNATGGDISYQELQAYCNVSRQLTAFEIEVIRELNQLHKRIK